MPKLSKLQKRIAKAKKNLAKLSKQARKMEANAKRAKRNQKKRARKARAKAGKEKRIDEEDLKSQQFEVALKANERDEAKEMANWDEFPRLNEGVMHQWKDSISHAMVVKRLQDEIKVKDEQIQDFVKADK